GPVRWWREPPGLSSSTRCPPGPTRSSTSAGTSTARSASAAGSCPGCPRGAADALWTELSLRIASLPEGVARMRAEAERAAYVERTRGADAAALEWRSLADRYPWSLGVLEDRLDFLARVGRGAEGRRVLAEVIPRAAQGHREALLGRLTRA